jgi:alkylhydroperoxidase family enzyme
MVGLDATQIAAARNGDADAAGDAALLALARRILDTRGHVPTAELDAFKAAGFDDAAILELLVNVVLNIYTNYTNHLARTDIDFPAAPAQRAA